MVNGVDLAVDPTSLVLLHSKLIYSGFFSWQTILTNKSSFMDLWWWVHKTNLVYKTPLIDHFLFFLGSTSHCLNLGISMIIYQNGIKNPAQNMNSQEWVLQTLCTCSVSIFDKRILARERKLTLSSYTPTWTLKTALFFWCFIIILWSAINTSESHSFGRSKHFNLISMCLQLWVRLPGCMQA
jgi:hypothetical protein